MRLKFIVISIFLEQHARAAGLGPKDPNISRSSVDEMLGSLGMNSPFHRKVELDPMWYLIVGGGPIGYIRVFEDERWARNWFNSLRDKTTAWAHWCNGRPLAWIQDADYQSANQFVGSIALCSVRAFTAEGAAKRGWELWSTGRLTAMDVYLNREVRDQRAPIEEMRNKSVIVDRPLHNEPKSVVSVGCGDWQVQRTTLSRTYEFSGLSPPETASSLKISCYLTKWDSGVINTELDFYVRPYLHLMPSRTPFADDLREAPFLVWLTADESEGGTLLAGGAFKVIACSIEDEPDTAFLRVSRTEDVVQCVGVISSGKKMTFGLLDKADHRLQLRLPLPNDGEFRRLYHKIRSNL